MEDKTRSKIGFYRLFLTKIINQLQLLLIKVFHIKPSGAEVVHPVCTRTLPSTFRSSPQSLMDTGIFHCKVLALPEAISFLEQEGTFRIVITVHKRFLTSLTNANLHKLCGLDICLLY